MSDLQAEFNALSGKIIRMDEYKTAAKQLADQRYGGIMGKLKYLREGIASIPEIPGMVSRMFSGVADAEAKSSEHYIDAAPRSLIVNDSNVYVEAISLLKAQEAVVGERLLRRSVLVEAVKACPDHSAKKLSGQIVRL